MHIRKWGIAVLSVVLTSVVLAGCSNAKTQQPAPASGAANTQRPPLQIPGTFANDGEKLNFAARAVADGYYAEAESLLEQVAAAVPGPSVYSILGTARYNMQNYTGAEEAWRKTAELDPRLAAEMESNIGNALRDGSNWAGAETAYRKAISLDPAYWTASVNLASMLKAIGKAEDAIEVLQAAVASNQTATDAASLLKAFKDSMPSK